MLNYDEVNHPKHYTSGNVECIDAMRAAFGDAEVAVFCKLNAFKYIWREGNKGESVKDIEKADWYLKKYIELVKSDTTAAGSLYRSLKGDQNGK